MCGICLIFKNKNVFINDLETLNTIKTFNQSFLEDNEFNSCSDEKIDFNKNDINIK